MRQTLRILCTVAFCMLLVGSVGCTRGRKSRTRLSGEVTAAGQPVSVGRITFRPASGLGTYYSGAIQNGRYAVRGRRTMPAGVYDVTIDHSSSGSSRGGYDRHHTERVTLAPFGRSIDFQVK